MTHFRVFLLLLVFSTGLFSCRKDDPGPRADHLLLGNPSDAVVDPFFPNNYLLVKRQYALSYSKDRGTPNWVSWHVGRRWLGNTPRQDDFRPDPSLPSPWYQVSPNSYRDTGFDRGHNTPSADRTASAEDNSATFLMTNMIPQAPNNNQNTWADLESYTRRLVDQGNEVYVVMGSFGRGGTGSQGYRTTLDNGRVTVPNRIWKVLVVLPEGDNDLNRISTSTRVIAVNTPNKNNLRPDWGSYRTTVNAIEAATGYDLLSNVPEEIQAVLESRKDTGTTQ
jgi:endonuclease G